ncbi:alpha/beta-hydrolase [Violaceomyces palustris]|uniref:Alpha/beta-hydrolase n=1 Tax=Violaceomyces palustris TaxID=1673888 RepID=A0ACD0NTS2_9BASI|nr:alpha/beta-hydrolase [Violaceomyces palustris]
MPTHTFTYKRAPDNLGGTVDVKLDLHLPREPRSDGPLPILLWFHGGGLLQGNKAHYAPHISRSSEKYGFATVSADYRLAPQVGLFEIQDDIVDAMEFVVEKLPAKLAGVGGGEKGGGIELDVGRIVVSGSSAGGWLALMLGLGMCRKWSKGNTKGGGDDGMGSLNPSITSSIRGVAAIYPITTLDHPFFLERQKDYFRFPDFDPESLNDPELSTYLDPGSRVISQTEKESKRNLLYTLSQRDGLFPSLLFPGEEAEGSRKEHMKQTSVPAFIQSNAERKDWPPVYIIHGDADTAVDVDQARMLAKSLKKVGAELTYEEVEGKNHIWDLFDPEEELEGFYRFVQSHF